MSEEGAVVSVKWIAARLGKSPSWFDKARPKLEAHGFPKRDGLLGGWIRADIEAWIERRRQIRDTVEVHHASKGIDYDSI